MSGKSLKVTDRRMFTADGRLREEYRDLEERSTASPAESVPSESGATLSRPPVVPADVREAGDRSMSADQPLAPPPEDQARDEPEAADGPGFMDLIGLLAEPAMIYLRQAQVADPRTAVQNLELARLHIDLLAVLRAKTEGNLSASEQAMLEDVSNQLRSGYVGLQS